MFVPWERMLQRYSTDRDESDVAAFYCLLFFGEMITKTLVAAMVAGVREDADRTRYALLHSLVRADGIGDWVTSLDQVVAGPASQHLNDPFRVNQRELAQRQSKGTWQYEAVEALHSAATAAGIAVDPLGHTVAVRQWFALFATLRNKTRGHGAVRGDECARVLPPLEASLTLLRENLSIFARPWAYLHRNLSGKYRVTRLSDDMVPFAPLKRESQVTLQDGVYIYAGEPHRVDLLYSDVDAGDFLHPNGQFRNGDFEVISYITNERRREPGQAYLTATTPLPPSETQGSGALDLQGGFFANLPPLPVGYVSRADLEARCRNALVGERHEIITLSGPGGAGKTSLAIKCLHELSREPSRRFFTVVWFSARDIDLLPSGPKPVRPHGVSLADFANEYTRLLNPAESRNPGFRPMEYFAQALTKPQTGATLFVFDNFETVGNSGEIFRWLDTYVRPPNKLLLTTRMRDFVGDYPIEVLGMTEDEAFELIDSVAARLGIADLLTPAYRSELFKEADGHPYVLKIMLGEVAKAGKALKPERLIASQEEILQALFERTFAALSPAAQRVFLMLANWRSMVPTLAVEAVLLRTAEERVDVRAAVDELRRLSLVEEVVSTEDQQPFVGVPIAAMTFGRRKLTTSPVKAVVEADTKWLHDFGAGRKEDVRHGVRPRVTRLIRAVAERNAREPGTLDGYWPILQFLATRVPGAWLEIAALYGEVGSEETLERAKESLRRYLEAPDGTLPAYRAWQQLADLCRRSGDAQGEIQALAEMCDAPEATSEAVSRAANAINGILMQHRRRSRALFTTDERTSLLTRVASGMERWLGELDATDLSRLAWVHLQLGNEARAAWLVERGLELSPSNDYCLSLKAKLSRY